MTYSRIVGTGRYLPERVLTNFDLEKMVDRFGVASTLSVAGPWSFFRLLDQGSIERSSLTDQFTVTFNVGGRVATFGLRANSVFNPFTLTALEQFRCPQL